MFFFNSYSATYGLISIKFCMLLYNVMSNILTNFREVLSFPLGFIGFLVYFATPIF